MKAWGLKIKNKAIVINGLLIFMVIMSSFWFKKSANNMKNLTLLGDGIQTCFNRAQQSFMAKLLSQGGENYLTNSFMLTTENCFGDLIAEFGESLTTVSEKNFRNLNELASRTHWLHEKLGPNKTTLLSIISKNSINRGFKRIEGHKDKLLLFIDSEKVSVENTIYSWSFLFYISLIGLFSSLIRNLIIAKKEREEKDHIEEKAQELLNGEFKKNKSKGLLENILRKENYQTSSQLLSRFQRELEVQTVKNTHNIVNFEAINYSTLFNLSKEGENNIDDLDYIAPKVIGPLKEKVVEIDGRKQNDLFKEINYPQLKSVHLEKMLTKAIDLKSNKLFMHGIVVDLDVDEKIYINGSEEPVEQIFYHVLANSIQACSTILGKKKIKINAKKLGNTILLNFIDSGVGLPSKFLKAQRGMIKEKDELSTGFAICHEFMEEFGGKINFENITNELELVVGSKVQLVFRAAEKIEAKKEVKKSKSQKRVSVKKSTKKELLDEFSQDI